MQDLRSILHVYFGGCFLLFTPYLNVIYTVTVKYKTSSFIDLVKSLMKPVWSDETGRIIDKVDNICCCVLLTSFCKKKCILNKESSEIE